MDTHHHDTRVDSDGTSNFEVEVEVSRIQGMSQMREVQVGTSQRYPSLPHNGKRAVKRT
jgi:hypothetical protein